MNSIPFLLHAKCPVCQKSETQNGKTCVKCFGKFSIDGIFAASSFKNSIVKKLIHLCKYRFVESASKQLGNLLIRSLQQSNIPLPDIIIPVPLHKKRLRWRGFNQSESLAQYISSSIIPGMHIPVCTNLIVRRHIVAPQAHIHNKLLREKNMHNMFYVDKTSRIPKETIRKKRIWIIDDVFTTGATLFECAKTLKHYEICEVYGIVIAH
jgi:ComF family protein